MTSEHGAEPAAVVGDIIERVADHWGLPELAYRTQVRISPRLTRNFGYCHTSSGRITIAERLLRAAPEVLYEVVVHELAHAAVGLTCPERPRPHGPEWAAFVRAAGVAPRVKMPPLPDDPAPPRYLHRCRVCPTQRIARRPMRAWRCVACYREGLSGELEIVRLDDPFRDRLAG